MNHLNYLQHLIDWARYTQQQFTKRLDSSGNGAGQLEHWDQRFHNLIQDLEAFIQQPYPINHETMLAFHRQANELYQETLDMYHRQQTEDDHVTENRNYLYQAPFKLGWSATIQQPSPQTKATYTAIVETMIPSVGGAMGAVDLQMDEYLMMILDHQIAFQENFSVETVDLSTPTAVMLDIAAAQLLAMKGISTPSGRGAFANLSHSGRIEAVRLLENLQIDLGILPQPFQNNAELIKYVITYVFQMVKFGYYSEWHAYGSTKFAAPEERVLERFPYTWELVGYPGVSLGYRAFRGFLVDEFSEEVK
ncbi:hypothetical protein [Virgibacillus kimchii]